MFSLNLENNVGRLATQLKSHPLQVISCTTLDDLADLENLSNRVFDSMIKAQWIVLAKYLSGTCEGHLKRRWSVMELFERVWLEQGRYEKPLTRTLSMSGCDVIAPPAVGPNPANNISPIISLHLQPVMTLTTPSGKPASLTRAAT